MKKRNVICMDDGRCIHNRSIQGGEVGRLTGLFNALALTGLGLFGNGLRHERHEFADAIFNASYIAQSVSATFSFLIVSVTLLVIIEGRAKRDEEGREGEKEEKRVAMQVRRMAMSLSS